MTAPLITLRPINSSKPSLPYNGTPIHTWLLGAIQGRLSSVCTVSRLSDWWESVQKWETKPWIGNIYSCPSSPSMHNVPLCVFPHSSGGATRERGEMERVTRCSLYFTHSLACSFFSRIANWSLSNRDVYFRQPSRLSESSDGGPGEEQGDSG